MPTCSNVVRMQIDPSSSPHCQQINQGFRVSILKEDEVQEAMIHRTNLHYLPSSRGGYIQLPAIYIRANHLFHQGATLSLCSQSHVCKYCCTFHQRSDALHRCAGISLEAKERPKATPMACWQYAKTMHASLKTKFVIEMPILYRWHGRQDRGGNEEH